MNLKIVYDNESLPGFGKGWGFSCLIELEDEKILFDTGWDGKILLANLRKFNTELKDINRLVLSHGHWDHIGGLPHIDNPEMSIYVPSSFSRSLKKELDLRFVLHEIKGPQKIRDGVWTTGELKNRIEEQSLVLETQKGLVVIAGCSHPGVRKILSAASAFGKLYGIVGGLHDFDDYGALEGMGLIAATHCTKNKAKIREIYPESFVAVSAGSVLEPGA
ncbi:MAG: MBL fold metallo-hydrolase [Desulfobacteraceae bacterium]|nr:MBL fold metallo-hydrolase [Desulfobacteraceae bacterium]